MRTPLPLLLTASALLLSTTTAAPLSPQPPTIIGTACIGPSLTNTCTPLLETHPNDCLTAVSGALQLDRSIQSLQITTNTACAFFTGEVCVNPVGIMPWMAIRGPRTMDTLPGEMTSAIQAYICGANATRFLGNGSVSAGGIVLARTPVASGAAIKSRRDPPGPAGTLYKLPGFLGQSLDIFSESCEELSNLFGAFDEHVRSVVVDRGFTCEFFTRTGCESGAGGDMLRWGEVRASSLGEGFDSRIRSFRCWGDGQ